MVSQHVGDRVRGLAERVDLVDDHLDVARLEECGEGIQVLAVHHTGDELHIGRAPPHQSRPRRPRQAREKASRVADAVWNERPVGC